MIEPQISVIVPVYNEEKYLPQCIESILNQTYLNVQLILVDDGSTDNSGGVCESFLLQDFRVSIIHQKNHGVAAARNAGLSIASGEWIAFSDSDDYLSLETLLTCIKYINNQSLDLVEYGYVFEDKEGKTVRESHHDIPKGKLLDKQYIHEKIIPQLIHTEPANNMSMGAWVCNKLFRAAIINKENIRFDEKIRLWEDGIFTIEYMQYVMRMVSLDQCFYHYRNTPNSLSTKHDPQIFSYIESIYEKYRGIYRKEYDFDSHAAKEYRFNLIHGTIKREIESDNSILQTYHVIQRAFLTDTRCQYFMDYHHRNPFFALIRSAVRLHNTEVTAFLYWLYFKLF